MKTAVYPGSFDPFTLGHKDILLRSSKIFDKVIVAIGENHGKQNLFRQCQQRGAVHQLRIFFRV